MLSGRKVKLDEEIESQGLVLIWIEWSRRAPEDYSLYRLLVVLIDPEYSSELRC